MGRRNVQGGNKTKTMASNKSFVSNKIRIPESEEEEYAVVVAVSGNGRFRIQTESGKKHMGVLPGSMKGHKKRNNYVSLNSIVLINNRNSWQTIKEDSTVDIEHIYSPNHIAELGLVETFQKQLSNASNSSSCCNVVDNNVFVVFSSSATPITENTIKAVVDKKVVEEDSGEEEEEFDIDLI